MHCDRVYAILTRGPFPSGDVTDVAVEIHLAHCVSCRSLAEALRPIEDGPENVPFDKARLPGYRGDHPEWRPATSASAPSSKSLRAARRSALVPRSAFQAGQLLAVALIGVAVGLFWSTVGQSHSARQRSGIAAASFAGRTDGWNQARVQAQLIFGLDLPRECSRLDMALFSPLSADERWPAYLTESPPSFVNQCCTQCHVAGGPTRVEPLRRRILMESCVICHGDSPRRSR